MNHSCFRETQGFNGKSHSRLENSGNVCCTQITHPVTFMNQWVYLPFLITLDLKPVLTHPIQCTVNCRCFTDGDFKGNKLYYEPLVEQCQVHATDKSSLAQVTEWSISQYFLAFDSLLWLKLNYASYNVMLNSIIMLPG